MKLSKYQIKVNKKISKAPSVVNDDTFKSNVSLFSKVNIKKLAQIDPKKVFIVAFSAMVLSFIFQIYTSNQYAVKGSELFTLINEHNTLETEVSKLSLALSAVGSLSEIEARAYSLGFVEMERPVLAINNFTTIAAITINE